MFPLICALINGCANNREAADLRCHRSHYDVTVIEHYFILYRAGIISVPTRINKVNIWAADALTPSDSQLP